MIVNVSYAECQGCGYREALAQDSTSHPTTWPALIDGTSKHFFCSHACLVESLTAGSVAPVARHFPAGLTLGEIETLELMAMGHSNKEIGRARGLAECTIKNQNGVLMRKLGAPSRIEAVLIAHRVGALNLNTMADRCANRLARAA